MYYVHCTCIFYLPLNKFESSLNFFVNSVISNFGTIQFSIFHFTSRIQFINKISLNTAGPSPSPQHLSYSVGESNIWTNALLYHQAHLSPINGPTYSYTSFTKICLYIMWSPNQTYKFQELHKRQMATNLFIPALRLGLRCGAVRILNLNKV